MNARSLVFSLLLFSVALLGGWLDLVSAEADGPDYWAVKGVSQDDHLNLRKGPSIKFSVIAQIPSEFTHLENLGCSPAFMITDWERFSEYERDVAVSLRWCRVRFHDHVGWVKGSYLQEGLPPDDAFPVDSQSP